MASHKLILGDVKHRESSWENGHNHSCVHFPQEREADVLPFPGAANVEILLYDYQSLMWKEKEGENILFSDVPDIQIIRQLDQ